MHRKEMRMMALAGATLGALRLLAGLALAVVSRTYPESNTLALLDAPTVGLYFLLAAMGVPVEVTDASDKTFLLVGTFVWATFGTLLIVGLSKLMRR